MPNPLWQPTTTRCDQSRLQHYMNWLAQERNLHFSDYDALWSWSTTEVAAFWATIWDYFGVISHTPYTRVLSEDPMPYTRWFEGATLNYVEMIFKQYDGAEIAIYHSTENQALRSITWQELAQQVSKTAAFLQSVGVQQGDRVVGYLPNTPEALIAFLATASLGAVWSCCSPDFGTASIVDRFFQIAPKVLIACDGYFYGGKRFNRQQTIDELVDALPSVEKVVLVRHLQEDHTSVHSAKIIDWIDIQSVTTEQDLPVCSPVPFGHPLYILFSSGTTGIPKAITHGHGGILLEHLKYMAFHNDVQAGENFFWFCTTGWMMWNFSISALLHGAKVVLYDGSPGYPDLTALWRMADELPIHHFGTSAPFLVGCMKSGLAINQLFQLKDLRSIGSTGSPLPPESFEYVYNHIKRDVWLASMSGGTDICTAWVGGNPFAPVVQGEIQCRCLGCAMESYDEMGHPVRNEVGEMVVTRPMPSMPVFFWNDPGFEKYTAAYFEHYAGVWRHGDWLQITDRGTCIILGRSDATLNRQGVRIGTAEIYRVLDGIAGIRDGLIVNLELLEGQHFMPLFIVLNDDVVLDDILKKQINTALRTAYSPRHVPDEIIAVADLPYTISGKKMEAPVKKVLMGIPLEKAANLGSVRNPAALDFFVDWGKKIEGKQNRL